MGDLVELGDELRLETHGELDAARDEWMRLAERAPNVFGTWEWASTWWRHFGQDAKPLVTICRRAEEPMAILPLCLAKERGVRTIRFIGHTVGTQLGPVCDPADAAEAARALHLALRAAPRWDLFVANDLPGEQRWQELLGGRVLRRTPSPVVNMAGRNWDQFLRTRSANFRQKARYFERKLEREHDLRYRLADDPDRLDADLDVLFALHAKRWGNAASSLFAPLQAFHREFATLALERGWLRLWLIELDGTVAAAECGFRRGPANVSTYRSAASLLAP